MTEYLIQMTHNIYKGIVESSANFNHILVVQNHCLALK